MRILYSSNAPWVQTGYGVQAAAAALYLRELGHDVALFAFYGLEGSKCDLGDVPVYPNDPRDFGIKNCKLFYDDFKADLLITHIDVWVMSGLDPNINWVPRMPVDHEPVPPTVIKVLKSHPAIIKPIVESKFGQRQLKTEGIDSYYIPPSIDTETFIPNAEARKTGRERYGWEDKFVIGMVATNHENDRKNWVEALKAVKVMADNHPGEIVFYMHTDQLHPRGINLVRLRQALGIEDITFTPSTSQMATGIERVDLARAYNVFDVFLLPSKGEGFGVPLIEAQACGVPVITTKCTAQEEVMGGGWFIERLVPKWTGQCSWQFDCHTEEVVERMEQAYQAKKDGTIKEMQEKARAKALEYENKKVYPELWKPVLDDIEKRIKEPRNLEGVQQWRLNFIPKTCVPRKVLDIGCGITQSYKQHLEHLGDYVGVDLRGGNGVVKMDAHKLLFPNKEFGFVWMSELLEHVDDPKKVIAEAKRVGRHGVCIFSTPQNPYFKGDPDHKVVKLPYTTLGSGDGLISW